MSTIGNILWFIGGGLFMGLAWWIFGVLMACTVIGIPWARACFVIGNLTFFPFGREAINRRELTGRDDLGTGALGMIGNIIWICFGGLWLALGHLFWALVCALTIIGIPFAIQHLKLASLSLTPVGMTVVSKDAAAESRRSR